MSSPPQAVALQPLFPARGTAQFDLLLPCGYSTAASEVAIVVFGQPVAGPWRREGVGQGAQFFFQCQVGLLPFTGVMVSSTTRSNGAHQHANQLGDVGRWNGVPPPGTTWQGISAF